MLGSLNIQHASAHHIICKRGHLSLNVIEKESCAKKKTFWKNYSPLIYENIENIWLGLTVHITNVQFYRIRFIGDGMGKS
jgi:hypothetical protein